MGSKLGPHINAIQPGIKEFIAQAKPRIIKTLDYGDPDFWREVKESSPDSFYLGRMFVPHQLLDNPKERARAFTEKLLPGAEPLADVFDAWEGYNEVAATTADGLMRLAEFEAEVARILHGHGLKSAVGGFATGNPEVDLWDYFWPALQEGDYLHLHEYSAPSMRDSVTWLCLRYRRAYERLPEHLRKPLLISECGIDGGVLPGAGGPRGWKEFTDVDGYMADLQWYDEELQKDDGDAGRVNVIGATIFCAGTIDPYWNSFNILGPVADRLSAHIQENPAESWRPEPGPAPELEHIARNTAWNSKGIPFNPDAAFPRYARKRHMGVPETAEFTFVHQGKKYVAQGFTRYIIYTEEGKWGEDDIQKLAW